MTRNRFSAPVLIRLEHETDSFDCGEPILDDWLRKRAMPNLAAAVSRSYVSCVAGTLRVAGYHALSMGLIERGEMPAAMRRNMPESIPSVVLGRLAVDRQFQGAGLGGWLLQDAITRSLEASKYVAAKLMVVHPLTEMAAAFYMRNGFIRLAAAKPTLIFELKPPEIKRLM